MFSCFSIKNIIERIKNLVSFDFSKHNTYVYNFHFTPDSLLKGEGIGQDTLEQNIDNPTEFTTDQEKILQCVNKIHEIYEIEFNFSDQYKKALRHIKNKNDDWYITTAVYIANAIQDIGVTKFIKCFEQSANPKEKEIFDEKTKQLQFCYDEIQKIRHAGKRGNSGESFKTRQDTFYSQLFQDYQDVILWFYQNNKMMDLEKYESN